MQKTISLAEARKNFSEITNDVAFNGTEYLILKHGKEFAKIIPPAVSLVITPEFQKDLETFATQLEYDLQALADS
jgi:antitoxin (DNA-binding transcriptional repressor) of toxin-antitoxin stability system